MSTSRRRPAEAGATPSDSTIPLHEEDPLHTNDSQPATGEVTAGPAAASTSRSAVGQFAGEVAVALRGHRDRTADQRVWPYALAPVVLAVADAALNGPTVLAQDVTMLTAGALDAAHAAVRVVVEAVTVR